MPGIIVLASGGGTTLQAIIDAVNSGKLACNILRVIADRDCFAIKRAEHSAIPVSLFDRKTYRHNLSSMIASQIDLDCKLVVLAGFLSILDSEFIKNCKAKIINLHPALLPKFGGSGMWGMHVHRAVLAADETESGCTIHYVDNGIDSGEIIKSSRLTINPHETPKSLQERVAVLERKLIVEVIGDLLK